MKFARQAVLGLSLALAYPAFAAPAGAPALSAAPTPAHVQAVQDLLGAMQVENVLRGVASRARYSNPAQRQAVIDKIDRTPPADVARRMAPALARTISADTAAEMTRFYRTPYGRQVLHDRYNSRAQIMMPGAMPAVPAQEKMERKRAAYVQASQALAAAEPAIDHEAFVVLQQINKEQR